MKKQKLILYIFVSFLLLLTEAIVASSTKSFINVSSKSHWVASSSSSSFPTLPYTNIEINTYKCVVSVCAQRSNAGPHSSFIAGLHPSFNSALKEGFSEEKNFSFKGYLLHIYPSHNFW